MSKSSVSAPGPKKEPKGPLANAQEFVADEKDINSFNLPRLIARLLQKSIPPSRQRLEPRVIHVLLYLTIEKYKLMKAPLLEISAPIKICGDLHGKYSDLLRIFTACGEPSQTRYLFLGNYVDHGRHSLEVVVLLFALQLAIPGNVFMLRGSHENEFMNSRHGFLSDITARYRSLPRASDELYAHFNKAFSWMPVAAIVSKRILCMHGGISPKLNSLDDIRKIPLPLETFDFKPLPLDLLFAHPVVGQEGFEWRKTPDKITVDAKTGKQLTTYEMMRIMAFRQKEDPCASIRTRLFGTKEVEKVCQKLDIDMVIRGHEAVEFGYQVFPGQRLITVFSTARFREDLHNYAAVVEVSERLEIGFVQLKPEEFEQRREMNGSFR